MEGEEESEVKKRKVIARMMGVEADYKGDIYGVLY